MKPHHKVTLLLSLFLLIATSGHSKETPAREATIEAEIAYNFVFSLLELKERTQHKHLSAEEIQSVADIFRTAKFEKEIERKDVLTTPYISRYQFTHGFHGSTKKSGKNESGMLTIDAQTLYWKGSIFTLEPAEATKLLEIIPKPVNENTISERPEGDPNNP
jgi:hypothetical protein